MSLVWGVPAALGLEVPKFPRGCHPVLPAEFGVPRALGAEVAACPWRVPAGGTHRPSAFERGLSLLRGSPLSPGVRDPACPHPCGCGDGGVTVVPLFPRDWRFLPLPSDLPLPGGASTLTQGLEGSACLTSPVSCWSPSTALCPWGGGLPAPGVGGPQTRLAATGGFLTRGFPVEVPTGVPADGDPLPLEEGVGDMDRVRLFGPGGGPGGWRSLPVPGGSQPVGVQTLYLWKGERSL